MGSETVVVGGDLLRRGHGDAEVNALRWGASEGAEDLPVLVCLHGLGGSHANWVLLGGLLAAQGEVWAPDLAGFGLTEPHGRSASVEDNIDLAAGFIQAVGGGRPVLLLGHSMGGHISYSLAAELPELVLGLVLINPAVPPLAGLPDRAVARRFLTLATPLVGEAYLARQKRTTTPAEEVQRSLDIVLAKPSALDPVAFRAHVEVARQRRRMTHSHSSTLLASRTLARRIGTGQRALWQAVQRVQAPGLILHGGADRLIQTAACDRLAARRPDWDYRVYDDLGHMVILEDPGRVAADIADWRSQLVPGAQRV